MRPVGGSVSCCILPLLTCFPTPHPQISSFLLAAIQFSVCTYMYKFFAEFAIKVSQVMAVCLAWLPVVCENIIILRLLFLTQQFLCCQSPTLRNFLTWHICLIVIALILEQILVSCYCHILLQWDRCTPPENYH